MTEAVTERPIIFSGPMVRAILEGRKTQTRRVVAQRHPISLIGGRDERDDPSAWGYFFDVPGHHGYMVLGRGHDERENHGKISIPSQYGEAGDRLWVRETHAQFAVGNRTSAMTTPEPKESSRTRHHMAISRRNSACPDRGSSAAVVRALPVSETSHIACRSLTCGTRSTASAHRGRVTRGCGRLPSSGSRERHEDRDRHTH